MSSVSPPGQSASRRLIASNRRYHYSRRKPLIPGSSREYGVCSFEDELVCPESVDRCELYASTPSPSCVGIAAIAEVVDVTDQTIRGIPVFHCHLPNDEDKDRMAKVLFT